MRVKQTAKKMTSDGAANSIEPTDNDDSNINDLSNVNELSDNEIEIVVECRRDTQGNQFLLDGTPVIEPAAVVEATDKLNQPEFEEIVFSQFIEQLQSPLTDKNINDIETNQANVKKPNVVIPNNTCQVKCTACNSRLNPLIDNSLHKHPVLEVILCKNCIENQKDKYFVIDEEDNKETLCRWCVEGGSLICCDFCPKSYCKTCIKRNLGRIMLSEILKQDDSVQWKCFSCDPTPIKSHQDSYNKLMNELNLLKEDHVNKTQMKNSKKPISRNESVSKKRSINKAFPNNFSQHSGMTNAKKSNYIKVPHSNPNLNTISLLKNMEGFGTEWYMRNVNVETILTGIDKIDSRSLLNAINSTKKCVEAFYSDIRNLENEISKVTSSTDISALVSMFKSVYRHHIFNRFCLVQSRIEEDKRSRLIAQNMNGISKKDFSPVHSTPNLVINSVISNAYSKGNKRINENSFTKNIIAKALNPPPISNGDRMSMLDMYSIDLTDDADKPDNVLNVLEGGKDQMKRNDNETTYEDSKEVVDLCNDDDSSSVSYPVVCMNFNNQLYKETDVFK